MKRMIRRSPIQHTRLRVVYGNPKRVEVWSYLTRRERESHVAIHDQNGIGCQIVFTVRR